MMRHSFAVGLLALLCTVRMSISCTAVASSSPAGDQKRIRMSARLSAAHGDSDDRPVLALKQASS